MSIASEFYEMAKSMLDDPEIGCDAQLFVKVQVQNPAKSWEPSIVDQPIPLRVFYTKAENGMVNGSLVLSGEKVCITYPPEGVALESIQTSRFVDHIGVKGVVNAIEPVTVGNETVILYLKVGS